MVNHQLLQVIWGWCINVNVQLMVFKRETHHCGHASDFRRNTALTLPLGYSCAALNLQPSMSMRFGFAVHICRFRVASKRERKQTLFSIPFHHTGASQTIVSHTISLVNHHETLLTGTIKHWYTIKANDMVNSWSNIVINDHGWILLLSKMHQVFDSH